MLKIQVYQKIQYIGGGAFSHDKMYRREGISWWEDELPTKEECEYAIANFKSWIIFVYDFLLKQKPVDSDTGKWIGFVFMVIVVIGFSMALIGTFGWLVHKLYTEYAYNWLSVAIALISLSAAVFFADELHRCDFNWFFGFLVIQILYLFMVIMDAGVNNQ